MVELTAFSPLDLTDLRSVTAQLASEVQDVNTLTETETKRTKVAIAVC